MAMLENVGKERRLEIFEVWAPRGLLGMGIERNKRPFTLWADDGALWSERNTLRS
jgi:hypothetical protein